VALAARLHVPPLLPVLTGLVSSLPPVLTGRVSSLPGDERRARALPDSKGRYEEALRQHRHGELGKAKRLLGRVRLLSKAVDSGEPYLRVRVPDEPHEPCASEAGPSDNLIVPASMRCPPGPGPVRACVPPTALPYQSLRPRDPKTSSILVE
jgi:hypothetical protein